MGAGSRRARRKLSLLLPGKFVCGINEPLNYSGRALEVPRAGMAAGQVLSGGVLATAGRRAGRRKKYTRP